MMVVRSIRKSLIDGIFQSLIFSIVGSLPTTLYTQKFSLEQYLFLAFVLAVFSTFFYFLLLQREENTKKIILISLMSMLWFVLLLILLFIIRLTVPFNVIPIKPLGNPDGIAILFVSSFWICTTTVLRLVVLLILIFRGIRKRRKTERHKDSSVVPSGEQDNFEF